MTFEEMLKERKSAHTPVDTSGVITKDGDAGQQIDSLIKGQKYVTWYSAHTGLGLGARFMSTNIPVIVDVFEKTRRGSSAILVDNDGKQAEKVAITHRAWLEAHGYTVFPGVKVKKAK